jgi:uncharacterized protein (UPF0332 family)
MQTYQMTFIHKAEDSLRAARILVENGLYGFAISRAYFSMLYVAQAFLLGEGLLVPKPEMVIEKFEGYFIRPRRLPAVYHQYLMNAHDKRHIADYDTEPEFTQTDALEHINHAQAFLALAATYLGKLATKGYCEC